MNNFIEKTINGIQNIFEDMFYSDEIADKKGIMQMIDPRVKLISTLIFIILVNSGKTIQFMVVLLVYVLFLAIFSRIPMKEYFLRVSVISIVFTGIILIPSLFNIIRKGEPLFYITKSIYITKQGLYSAVMMMMRTFMSISLVYILGLSTKWANVMRSLRIFRLPQIFTATLEMAQRYIFLLLEAATDMFLARKSRNVGKITSSEGRKFVAGTIGHLMIKSNTLGDEVYSAMVSRGYTGNFITIDTFKIRLYDWIWIIFNIAFILFLTVFIGGLF
ncbi:cobalt ECF transporter T component CbiQ [Aceticella autotrophica]|uniref:Cobalt ECF transporter T component CbiQ n=1 Tax=Aceticella autotrophica TaxID=2755338 RepID=A0A975GAE9_9THEO|nr:cobalt ECF transporter T component CbiQ [Aceticella autotrophica]QSZ27308.1 cobalt ECF transporter T component CbiQ [Aceticella autotrophica]